MANKADLTYYGVRATGSSNVFSPIHRAPRILRNAWTSQSAPRHRPEGFCLVPLTSYHWVRACVSQAVSCSQSDNQSAQPRLSWNRQAPSYLLVVARHAAPRTPASFLKCHGPGLMTELCRSPKISVLSFSFYISHETPRLSLPPNSQIEAGTRWMRRATIGWSNVPTAPCAREQT